MYSKNIPMAEKRIVCFQSKKVKICRLVWFLTTNIYILKKCVTNICLVYLEDSCLKSLIFYCFKMKIDTNCASQRNSGEWKNIIHQRLNTVITLCFRTLKIIISVKNRGVQNKGCPRKHVFVHLKNNYFDEK